MPDYCPKDCPDRAFDCHPKCDRYNAKKAEMGAIKAKYEGNNMEYDRYIPVAIIKNRGK